jgi:hypothetical protein
MGQSALLFDENYRPKPVVEAFRQGIREGLASTSVQPRAGADVAHYRVLDGVLRTDLSTVDHVDLRTATGSIAARVLLRAGRGVLPTLPAGVYSVWPAGATTSPGFVTLW